jgi:hypothetical protein
MLISRRAAILSTASAGLVALTGRQVNANEDTARERGAGEPSSSFPSQEPELVREIVGASHARIDRVRELLSLRPALAKAAWDWGFGDWETALGAASHVGNREIAALLMKHGARPDIFTFAMLGQLEVVKAYIAGNPGIARTHGPHGITLLSHAKAGGDEAESVVKYLTQLGDADIGQTSLPLTEDSKKLYLGEYRMNSSADGTLSVQPMRTGDLSIQRGAKGSARKLYRSAEHTFAPAGSAAVEIKFEVKNGAVTGLKIVDGAIMVSASRI